MISEIEVFETDDDYDYSDPDVNVAFNKTVYSTGDYSSSYPKTMINDGNRNGNL